MSNQFERMSFKEKLLIKFETWCKKTTLHAVVHIIESSNWFLRIMWLLLFLGGFAYCLYVLIQTFTQYFNYRVSVSIERIQETPVKFPAVTICNLNTFNNDAYDYFNKNNLNNTECFEYDRIKNGTSFQECFENDDSSSLNFIEFIDSAKRFVASDSNLNLKSKFSLGYDLDNDLLVSCNFNGLKCTGKNFTKFWDNDYGNCYTINNDNHLTSSITGNKNGLQLELVVSKS
jgi:hypothetical protein